MTQEVLQTTFNLYNSMKLLCYGNYSNYIAMKTNGVSIFIISLFMSKQVCLLFAYFLICMKYSNLSQDH